jgi:hypothetical protein
MHDFTEFDELVTRAEAMRRDVEAKAKETIGKALVPLLSDFPGHRFSFQITAIGPAVCVDTPIDEKSIIPLGVAESLLRSHRDDKRFLDLRNGVALATSVADYVRQGFGLSIPRFAVRPELPTPIFEGSFFRALDQGERGVEVSFLYDGSDWPTESSKWFVGPAARQIDQAVKSASVDDDYFRRRCGLDWSEVVSFERTAPGP